MHSTGTLYTVFQYSRFYSLLSPDLMRKSFQFVGIRHAVRPFCCIKLPLGRYSRSSWSHIVFECVPVCSAPVLKRARHCHCHGCHGPSGPTLGAFQPRVHQDRCRIRSLIGVTSQELHQQVLGSKMAQNGPMRSQEWQESLKGNKTYKTMYSKSVQIRSTSLYCICSSYA